MVGLDADRVRKQTHRLIHINHCSTLTNTPADFFSSTQLTEHFEQQADLDLARSQAHLAPRSSYELMIGSCGQPVSQGGQDKHMSPRVQLMRAANPAGHEQQCHHPKQPMGAGEQRLGNQSNAIMSANQASRRSGKRWPAIVSVSLPLLFMFLLPSLKRSSDTIFESSNRDAKIGCSHLAENLYRALSSPDGLFPADDLSLVGMLLSLIKLPLDRWRLEQIGLSAEAREISSKQDLQEEEQQTTHLSMMLAPAEPQLNYAQPVTASVYHQGANGPVSYQRHFGQAPVAYQRHIGQTPGPALEVASQAEQPTSGGDYATSGVSGDVEPVLAPVEGQALATQGDSAAASAQSTTSLAGRNDLPAVRALNVKCEKNHMTVSKMDIRTLIIWPHHNAQSLTGANNDALRTTILRPR